MITKTHLPLNHDQFKFRPCNQHNRKRRHVSRRGPDGHTHDGRADDGPERR